MAKSSFYVASKPSSPAEELRDQLEELEAKVGRLGYGLGQEALTIPLLFDEISERLASFQAEGHGMRAEEARLRTVAADFRRKARVSLREIGGRSALQEARDIHQPDPSNWWWYLDQVVADERRARLRRGILVVGSVAAALLLLAVLYQLFLAPDPATRERLRRQHSAESLAAVGDLNGALSEVEQGLAVAPDDPSLLILKGSLHEGLGQDAEAEDAFTAAEAALGEREDFLLARGRTYLLLDRAEDALGDAEAILELNPESAPGFMLMGRSHELQQNYIDALFAYEQAATLAESQGDSRLAATARVNMGILLQMQRGQ